MIQVTNAEDCCGCSACASICPHDAITMKPDVLGFLYPHVDVEKCINCGLCEKVCSFNSNYDKTDNLIKPDAYALRHKDINEIEKSRSGAAFIAISDYIIEHDGVIYGAGYTDHFRVIHKRASTKEERNEFRGSKYVQSDMNSVFRQVKQDLEKGLIVLFSGTPCQTSGLNAYIGKKLRKNLFLMDIVCHGVPAPYIWKDYLNYLEKKNGSSICEVNFRDKQKFGWTAHKETFEFTDRYNASKNYSCYTYLFYQHIMFRHSCGNCHFCNTIRPSDMTIADFWGWEKTDPNFNKDDKGVSLALINTPKGSELFEKIKEKVELREAKIENCLQPNLQYPSVIHPQRMVFEKEYGAYGFKYVYYKYGNVGWRYKLKTLSRKIKSKIKS